MTTTDTILLDILRQAIRGNHFTTTESITNEQWRAILDRAEEQKILPLIIDAAYPFIFKTARELIGEFQDMALTWVKRQIEQTNEFLVLLHDMQHQGLDPIVMKGLVCRELYPQPMLRYSVDEDLLVDDSQFEAFHHVLVGHGLLPDKGAPDFGKEVEISYHHSSSPLYVELHRRMFMPDQEIYGLFSSFFDDVHQHNVAVSVQDMQVRTLAPTDHLLFLFLHAYKHFLGGGVGIRQLCDIGLFAEKYGQQVDWSHVTRSCHQAGMGLLPAAFLAIITDHLGIGLEEAGAPVEWLQAEVDVGPLLDDILTGGLMGNVDDNRMHSSNITLGAVAAKGSRHRSLAGIFRSLFPPAAYVKDCFPYVRRCPFLLPVGWVHRIVNYLVATRRDKSVEAMATLRIGKERVELLKKYEII